MSILLIDLEGQQLNAEEVELLQHPLVAGVILFSRNFSDREQIQALIADLRQRVKKSILITVDQEGGRVQRFRKGFTQLPAMQAFANLLEDPTIQLQYAQEAGWQMAAEMTALDIDLSFAPVLDIGHQCRAIGDRSFHDDPQKITSLARAFIEGMHEVGMASTGKHFPGHGHVTADSHLETPCDSRQKQEIFDQDILPFRQLIKQDLLDAIMPAHVIYNQCNLSPASGSSYWLKTVLRQTLGFQGVIFSDDLGMKGAEFMGSFTERCEKAYSAGCDVLLLCNERQGVIQVLDQFKPQQTSKNDLIRQKRLRTLFKKQHLDWQDLASSSRWRKNQTNLTALQQRWLDVNQKQ